MFFRGQAQIINQLRLMLPQMYEQHIPANFLLRGRSGYGKTKLALSMAQYLAGHDFNFCMGDNFKIDRKYWVQLIDEVHLLKDPEALYPILDGGEFVFILCTNDQAPLKEPLINRCIDFHFTEYSEDDLVEIVRDLLPVAREQAISIIKAGGGNPRIITRLCQRLKLLSRADSGILLDVTTTLKEVIGVEDGLDVAARDYLRVLTQLGGRAALPTICSMLHLDENTVRAQVEPVLLWNNKIKITSRGREVI